MGCTIGTKKLIYRTYTTDTNELFAKEMKSVFSKIIDHQSIERANIQDRSGKNKRNKIESEHVRVVSLHCTFIIVVSMYLM